MNTLDKILKEINDANSIVILAHENPDGDAIGSALALYQALKKLDKDVDVVIPKHARQFDYLKASNEIKTETDRVYDLAIAVDTATAKLLNTWVSYFEEAKIKIVIDHHSTNSRYGDINYVDFTAPACAQVLYNVMTYYNWDIDVDIAECLLTGIITDTGGLQYEGVSPETFKLVSDIIEKGVNITGIYKNIFEVQTRSAFELKKIALNRLEFLENGKIAFTYINNEDAKKVKSEMGDYEGIVNEGRKVEGVEVSIFLHELEEGYKASLRSNSYVNVSDVCLMFGGGGHQKAAGVKMTGTTEEIKEKLVTEIKRQLKD